MGNSQLDDVLTPKNAWKVLDSNYSTLPETNIAPENWWLEDYFPFGKAFFQVLC